MDENNEKIKMNRKKKYFIAYSIVIILAICMTFFVVEQRKHNRNKQNSNRETEEKANQDSYNNEIANQYNHESPSNNPTVESKDEPKETTKSEEQIYREELRKKYEEARKINDDILTKIEKNGFKKISNHKYCYSADYCYSDGYMEVEVDPSRPYVYFYVASKREDRNTYDVKKDLSILANVYDKQSILSFSEGINKLLNQYDDSILIETDLVRLQIFPLTNYIEYLLSNPISYEDLSLRPTYVDSIIFETDNGKEKRDFYDFSMINNYKYFDFYDYVYNHIENGNVCSIKLVDDSGYTFDSDYCHGGTSNINYIFSYSFIKPDYKSVYVDVKGSYFKESYISFIKKDLEYFSNKLNKKFELSQDEIEKLNYFIKDNQSTFWTVVNDKVIIDIKYFDSNYFKDYIITYRFK